MPGFVQHRHSLTLQSFRNIPVSCLPGSELQGRIELVSAERRVRTCPERIKSFFIESAGMLQPSFGSIKRRFHTQSTQLERRIMEAGCVIYSITNELCLLPEVIAQSLTDCQFNPQLSFNPGISPSCGKKHQRSA